MDEIWKPIDGHPFYEVSNLGRVRSLDRTVFNNGSGKSYLARGTVLKCRPDKDGYRLVTLYVKNRASDRKVHRLVAIAFLGGDRDETVNHKDGIRHNNRLGNLEWMSHADNCKHAKTVLMARFGPKNPIVGTNARDGTKIGFLTVMAAFHAGFNRTNMHLALRHKGRVYHGYTWGYAR